MKTTKTAQYRFENGSLYEYDEESHAYIYCYRRVGVTTKRQAIKEYEEQKHICDPLDPTDPRNF